MVSREILDGLRFFQGLPAEYVEQLAGIAEERNVEAGSMLFREGETASHVHIVCTGKVSLQIRVPGRGPIELQTIGPGELLGWSTLLNNGPMTAAARAATDCRLISLNAVQLLALCEHEPRLGMEVMRRLASSLSQRLRYTRLHLLDVYRHEFPPTAAGGGQS
jgi:CRP/FNR family cyclic AMP-dependent transcriptional regulator